MSQFGLSGLVSGVSTDSIIEQILKLESTRITREQLKRSGIEARQSAWQKVRGVLEQVRAKSDALRLVGTYQAREATFSDSTVAAVTVTPGAAVSTHNLSVTQLAQTHVVAGATQASPNTALGFSGFLTIRGVQVEVTSQDTLASLRDKVNNTAGSVASAQVQKVMNGTDTTYRLVLTSKEQGAAGDLTMTDDQGGLLLENLGFTVTGSLNELAAAQDALFTFNSVDYQVASNEVKELLPGISLTLLKAGAVGTPLTTSIAISHDTERAAKAAEDWVASINTAEELLKNLTMFDAKTGQRGLLQGDALARNLHSSLRNMVTGVVAGLPSDLNRLSQVGVKTGAWGTSDYGKIVVDRSKLVEQLLANEEGVARLFGALSTNVAAAAGGGSINLLETSATAAGDYDASDVLNGDTDPDRFGSVGGGWESASTPSVEPQILAVQFDAAKSVDRVRIYLPEAAGTVGIKDFTVEYRDGAGVWQQLAAVTDHTGSARTVTFDAVTTDEIRVVVTATHGDSPVRVTELEALQVNSGIAAGMNQHLNEVLALRTGPIDLRNGGFHEQIKRINQQIDRITERMTQRETRLRQQFARMEEALAKMQAQGNNLSMQMTGLMQMQQSGR